MLPFFCKIFSLSLVVASTCPMMKSKNICKQIQETSTRATFCGYVRGLERQVQVHFYSTEMSNFHWCNEADKYEICNRFLVNWLFSQKKTHLQCGQCLWVHYDVTCRTLRFQLLQLLVSWIIYSPFRNTFSMCLFTSQDLLVIIWKTGFRTNTPHTMVSTRNL